MSAPLFFIPGWGLGRGPLTAMVDALGGQFIDLPGYCDTPLIESFDQAVNRLAASLPAGSHLAGWSLGALLALAIAARHPDKVGKLVLISGTPSFIQRADWPHAMPRAVLADFAAAIASGSDRALTGFVAGFNAGDARARAVSRELLALAERQPPTAVLSVGLEWLQQVDLRAELHHVTAPTLLIHGALDPLMPLAAARSLAASLPAARLEVLAQCAHAPCTSDPAAVLALLRAFEHD